MLGVVAFAAKDGGGAALAVVALVAAAEAEELGCQGRARGPLPRARARLGPVLLVLGSVGAVVRGAARHHRGGIVEETHLDKDGGACLCAKLELN